MSTDAATPSKGEGSLDSAPATTTTTTTAAVAAPLLIDPAVAEQLQKLEGETLNDEKALAANMIDQQFSGSSMCPREAQRLREKLTELLTTVSSSAKSSNNNAEKLAEDIKAFDGEFEVFIQLTVSALRKKATRQD